MATRVRGISFNRRPDSSVTDSGRYCNHRAFRERAQKSLAASRNQLKMALGAAKMAGATKQIHRRYSWNRITGLSTYRRSSGCSLLAEVVSIELTG
jgi:hypothetical protein